MTTTVNFSDSITFANSDATGATEFVDATTGAAFIPVIYSKEAVVQREAQLVAAKLADRRFEDDAAFGSTIVIPSISNLSVQTKNTASNAATVFETVTETTATIAISVWEYSAIAIETFTAKQVNRDLISAYAPKQGYALAKSVDTALAGLYSSGSSNNVGTLTIELAYDDVLRARQYLDDADVPASDRYVVVSPAQETGFMKLEHFVHSDYKDLQGDVQTTALDQAFRGTWLGLPVYKTTNLSGSNSAGHHNVMAHRDAFALVMQQNAVSHKQFDVNYLADKIVVEQIYGKSTIRGDHSVDLKGA